MAKFNPKKTTRTVNKAGGTAFILPMKLELITRVCTSLVGEPGYYGSTDAGLKACAEKVLEVDPVFVLKLASYARNEMYLRSVPILLWTLYANCNTKEMVHNAALYGDAIVQRADEILELMAAQKSLFPAHVRRGGAVKLPHITKTVIRNALNKFDEYQFGKYSGSNKEFKFRDAIFMTHPSPKNAAQQAIFQKIVDQNLPSPDTWEVHISTKGSSKKTWEEILPKMGYMAVLRNVRNFVQNDVNLMEVAARLADESAIKKSKQFPFRFLSALRANSTAPPLITSVIKRALEVSTENVPKFPGRTLIMVDTSGSMTAPLSPKGAITRMDVAALLGAICQKSSEASIVVAFASEFRQVVWNSERMSTLDAVALIESQSVGYSTDAWKVLRQIIADKIVLDRIIMLSDMQCYGRGDVGTLYSKYRSTISPNCHMYSIDLAGYGTAQVNPRDSSVFTMAGWNERILEMIPMLEKGDGMIDVVESYRNPVRRR